MSSKEKTNVLNNFRIGKIKLIVSTVVIEVGIDIPDANIIVIENGEIVESGNHEDLIKLNGKYANYYYQQFLIN